MKYIQYLLFICIVLCASPFNKIFAEGRGSTAGLPYGAAAKNGAFTLFAYATAGEKIDYLIAKTRADGGSDGGWSVQLYSPLGPVGSACVLGNVVGNQCTIAKLTVAIGQEGIWAIQVTPLGNESNNCVSFDLSVYNSSSVALPGRVYANKINGNDKSSPVEADFTLYFLTTDGYQYSTVYKGLTGLNYTIVADNLGVRTSGTSCVSAYRSKQYTTSSTNVGPDSSSCGNRTKIFFNPFASDLPASAPRYNIGGSGQITEPLIFTPAIPTVSTPVFTRSAQCRQQGTLSFTSTNYSGIGFISYDVNNDGDLNDPEDRIDTVNFASGVNTKTFDGLNKLGQPIPVSQVVSITVSTNKLGETHFVMSDIEILRSGIEVTRLNGVGSPDKTLYWDDTNIPSAGNCTVTSVMNGSAGVSSTGGVHGWNSCGGGGATSGGTNANNGVNGSWGDNRLIDNWAYYLPASATQTIIAPAVPLADYGDLSAAWPIAKAFSGGTDTNGDCIIDNRDSGNVQAIWLGSGIDFELSQNFSSDASLDLYDDGLVYPPSSMTKGGSYNFGLKLNSNAGNKTVYYGVWFDWNNNGIFTDDVDCSGNPAFYNGSNTTPAGGGIKVVTIPMCVPTDALEPGGVSVNDYKVRIIVSETPLTASMYNANFTNGEVEDYKLPLFVLPVSFGKFKAASKDCAVQLSFETYSEYYSDHFNVERSADLITWKNISSITSHSPGNILSAYQYEDANAGAGIFYYRIKQVDISGQYQYSNIIKAENYCNAQRSAVNFTNPVKNEMYISLPPQFSNAVVTMINVAGQAIAPPINRSANNSRIVNMYAYPAGVYVLRILKDGAVVYSNKFIKQ